MRIIIKIYQLDRKILLQELVILRDYFLNDRDIRG